MRKIILTVFSFLIFVVGYSQKYQPVDSTTIWHTHNYYRFTSDCCYEIEDASFQFSGYEVNNGNTWLKLNKSALYSLGPCFPASNCGPLPHSNFTNAFFGYVMNDSLNKRVYFTPTLTANYTPTTANIVYDFLNKNVGDSIQWKCVNPPFPSAGPPTPKFNILAIDSFLFAGKYHKRFKVENSYIFAGPPRVIYVMEGIGSTLGPWNSTFTDFEANSTLTCFSKPAMGISVSNYTVLSVSSTTMCSIISKVPELKPTVLSIYPNPVNNLITFENVGVSSVFVYDMFGKTLMEQKEINGSVNVESLQPGIYFLKIRSGDKNYTSKFVKD